jgi:hypothetical protein
MANTRIFPGSSLIPSFPNHSRGGLPPRLTLVTDAFRIKVNQWELPVLTQNSSKTGHKWDRSHVYASERNPDKEVQDVPEVLGEVFRSSDTDAFNSPCFGNLQPFWSIIPRKIGTNLLHDLIVCGPNANGVVIVATSNTPGYSMTR